MRPRVCGLWDLRGGDGREAQARDDSALHSQVYCHKTLSSQEALSKLCSGLT